jgi:hypothetical protein
MEDSRDSENPETVAVDGVEYEINILSAMGQPSHVWRLLLECRWASAYWPVRHVRLHECTVVAPTETEAYRRGKNELVHVLEQEAQDHP